MLICWKERSRLLALFLVVVIPVLLSVLLGRIYRNHQPPTPYIKGNTFPPSRIYRQYHTCNYQPSPYVHSEIATARLLLASNASFVRFGDLDIDLINGVSWPNQKATPELSQALLRVLHSNISSLYIGLYDTFSFQARTTYKHQDWLLDHDKYRLFLLNHTDFHREYFSTVISSPYVLNKQTTCVPVEAVYQTLRNIWKNKNLIVLRGLNGQRYEYDVYDSAATQKVIYAPRYQAWDAYLRLKHELLDEPEDSLYVLSAGPVAKVLTYDLTLAGRRALDMGHLAKDYNMYRSMIVPDNSFYDD